eukprot:scpid67016/ scgid22221/ 
MLHQQTLGHPGTMNTECAFECSIARFMHGTSFKGQHHHGRNHSTVYGFHILVCIILLCGTATWNAWAHSMDATVFYCNTNSRSVCTATTYIVAVTAWLMSCI